MNRTILKPFTAMTALALALALGAGGCATVKKKFTRKTTAVETRPSVYTEKEFIKPYTNEYYYTNSYNLWKVWQEELIKSIDGANSKSSARSADEAVARLKEMQEYLEEPKRGELGEQIRQIQSASADVRQGISAAQMGQVKFVLEKTLRVIKTNFYTDDVKPWLKKDDIAL